MIKKKYVRLTLRWFFRKVEEVHIRCELKREVL